MRQLVFLLRRFPARARRTVGVGACLAGLVVLASPSPAPAEELRAGVGEAVFDLPEGVSLAGYGGGGRRQWLGCVRRRPYARRFKPSRGVLDPTGSRALVFGWGERKIALVSTDLVAVSSEMRAAVLEGIADLGIGPGDLFLAATHTHSGPSGFARPKIWQWAAADRFVQELFDLYVASIVASLRQADARLEPSLLAIGAGRIDGVTQNRRDQPDKLDPVATVIRLDRSEGRPSAAVVNFPIHPTVLTEKNLLLSADVAGAIERSLEEVIGVPVIFLNGAEGDVAPKPPSRTAEGMAELGRSIAAAVAEIWKGLEPQEPSRVETVQLLRGAGRPRLNVWACLGWNRKSGRWQKKLRSPHLSTEAPVGGLRIDQHVFLALPGEPIVELGLKIKQQGDGLGFESTSILGLTNDYLGYFLSTEEYLKGGYESCGSWYGPDLEAKILEGAAHVLAALAD